MRLKEERGRKLVEHRISAGFWVQESSLQSDVVAQVACGLAPRLKGAATFWNRQLRHIIIITQDELLELNAGRYIILLSYY